MTSRRVTVVLFEDFVSKYTVLGCDDIITVIRTYFAKKYRPCETTIESVYRLVVKGVKSSLTDSEIGEDLERYVQGWYKEPPINIFERIEIEVEKQGDADDDIFENIEIEELDEDEKGDNKTIDVSKDIEDVINGLKKGSDICDKTVYDRGYYQKRKETNIKKTIENCEQLIGGKQFKKLCAEMVQIAPKLTKDNLLPVFQNQSYLFAINEGCGFSTAMKCFTELLYALGFIRGEYYKSFVLNPKRSEDANVFEEVKYYVKSSSLGGGVVSIDISNWMSDVNDRLFKNFLKELSQSLENVVVVFKIPFVDKAVLMDILNSLNDVMYVRPVAFPPLNTLEIREYAKRVLREYEFTMASKAWECFDERILLERADGRFYGMNTVKKVVGELVYKKQLDNAIKNKDDRVISARDAKKIIGDNALNDLSGEQMLNGLVGGESIKKRIYEIISQIELSMREEGVKRPCIHMRFIGNPGTGKTTVARAIGKLLRERGVLRVGGFFEYHGRNFCGRFIGETAPKTASICRDAYGSVLFIDEAYSLYTTSRTTSDYGKEAIDTLISEMENHRTDLLVIMAGYPDEMQTLMTANAGLESRTPHLIEFPNFTREELFEIYKNMLKRSFQYSDDLLDACKEYFDNLPDDILNSKSFSNARFVRNLFERTWAKASTRAVLDGSEKVVLSASDFKLAISDKEFDFNARKKNIMGFI